MSSQLQLPMVKDFRNLDPCSSAQKEVGMINTLPAVLATGGLTCAQRVCSAYMLLIIVQDVLV